MNHQGSAIDGGSELIWEFKRGNPFAQKLEKRTEVKFDERAPEWNEERKVRLRHAPEGHSCACAWAAEKGRSRANFEPQKLDVSAGGTKESRTIA